MPATIRPMTLSAKHVWSVLCVGVVGLVATSCMTTMPTTQIKTVWKDPQFNTARFHRALVIGVLPVPQRRKLFEDEVAKQLRPYGDIIFQSYKFFPTLDSVDRAQVEIVVKDQQIDLIFITRLIDKTTTQALVPEHTTTVPPDPLSGPISYFNAGTQEVTQPGYVVDQTVVVLETKVFESRNGACVWTCRSDTLMNGYLDDLVRDFAWEMTRALYLPNKS